MQIPKKIKLGAFDIPVILESNLEIDGEECVGLWNSRELTITLDPSMNPQHMASTFLHEIIHAVFWNTGITFALPEGYEETLTAALCCGLYQVIKDNKLKFE